MNKFFLFLILAVAMFSGMRASAQQPATAPTLKNGDTWQFEVVSKGSEISTSGGVRGTHELVFTDGQLKVYEGSGAARKEVELNADDGANLLAMIRHDSPRSQMKFPLAVGQKWEFKYRYRSRGAKSDQDVFATVQVLGIEAVTTPAGSFDSYKLQKDERGSRGANRTITFFYSPATKSIVKWVSDNAATNAHSEITLLKFTPGP
jgi:hypothetical protein